jgi:hypothetical protein
MKGCLRQSSYKGWEVTTSAFVSGMDFDYYLDVHLMFHSFSTILVFTFPPSFSFPILIVIFSLPPSQNLSSCTPNTSTQYPHTANTYNTDK